MSKDIIIQKNGVPTNVTAEIIRTNGIEGGSVDWVPEDEVQLLEDKEITKNGEYVAADEGYYGYKAVSVVGRNKEDIKLISKTIEANGTYRAESDGAYGYSRLSVRVKGGATYTDPDTGQKVTPDPSPDNGSTIVGLNSDGNEEAVKIIDGQKKKLELASYIQADTLPSILEYHDGDRIFLSGLVAHGYKADGTPYKGTMEASVLPLHQDDEDDPQYTDDFLPGGIVFNMPLYADISKAEGGGDNVPSDNIFNLASFDFLVNEKLTIRTGESRPVIYEATASSTVYLTYSGGSQSGSYSGRVGYLFASESSDLTVNGWDTTRSRTYNGKTVYYVYDTSANNANIVTPWITSQYSSGSNNAWRAAWLMVYGGYAEKKQTITLTWPREGDRKHLQTTYEITVTE